MLKHLIRLIGCSTRPYPVFFRQVTLRSSLYPISIVATSSGSYSSSMTKVFCWFRNKTFSSVEVDNWVSCPSRLAFGFSKSSGISSYVGEIRFSNLSASFPIACFFVLYSKKLNLFIQWSLFIYLGNFLFFFKFYFEVRITIRLTLLYLTFIQYGVIFTSTGYFLQ